MIWRANSFCSINTVLLFLKEQKNCKIDAYCSLAKLLTGNTIGKKLIILSDQKKERSEKKLKDRFTLTATTSNKTFWCINRQYK
jgi:hypothetical protein